LKERVSRASRLLRANPSLGCDGILVHACIWQHSRPPVTNVHI
jgi:hypothetical protein